MVRGREVGIDALDLQVKLLMLINLCIIVTEHLLMFLFQLLLLLLLIRLLLMVFQIQ